MRGLFLYPGMSPQTAQERDHSLLPLFPGIFVHFPAFPSPRCQHQLKTGFSKQIQTVLSTQDPFISQLDAIPYTNREPTGHCFVLHDPTFNIRRNVVLQSSPKERESLQKTPKEIQRVENRQKGCSAYNTRALPEWILALLQTQNVV